jgi:hypothetical protein
MAGAPIKRHRVRLDIALFGIVPDIVVAIWLGNQDFIILALSITPSLAATADRIFFFECGAMFDIMALGMVL